MQLVPVSQRLTDSGWLRSAFTDVDIDYDYEGSTGRASPCNCGRSPSTEEAEAQALVVSSAALESRVGGLVPHVLESAAAIFWRYLASPTPISPS